MFQENDFTDNFLDDQFNKLYEMVDNAVYDADVNYTVENTGIGSYEYWGATGFDHGMDVLLIEEPTYITVKFFACKRLLNMIAGDIVTCHSDENDIHAQVVGHIIGKNDQPVKIYGYIHEYFVKQNEVTFKVEWNEEQDKL